MSSQSYDVRWCGRQEKRHGKCIQVKVEEKSKGPVSRKEVRGKGIKMDQAGR